MTTRDTRTNELSLVVQLDEYVFHHMSMDVGQSSFESVVIERQPFVIESHQVQERGVEVVDGGLVDGRFESELVAFAVAESLLHAGSGQEAGERTGVVIAAGSVGLQERHATEFGRPDDQRVFQQAALFHVGDQRGRRLIHDLGLHRMRLQRCRSANPSW